MENLSKKGFGVLLTLSLIFSYASSISAEEQDENAVSENPAPQCSDGLDNDQDGLLDADDPGCHEWEDIGGEETYLPDGDNEGADNDDIPPPETPAPIQAASFSVQETTGLTAILESLSSQLFPHIFLNIRVEEDGNPITDLSQENFQCTENGTPQTDNFHVTPPEEGGSVRLADVVFLIDTSGSMGGAIAGVRNNVNAFADALAGSSIDVRLGLVQFGQSSYSGAPQLFNGGNLTGDIDEFKGFVNTLYASGGYEPGFLALQKAAQEFTFRPGAQKVFLLISDEDSDAPRDKVSTIALLNANDITVHTAVNCLQGVSQSDYCNETSVRGETGGLLFGVQGPYDEVLDEIVEQTASTYVVRYTSSTPESDGNARDVECTITKDADTATVRDSYFPNSAPKIRLTTLTEILNNSSLPEDSPSANVQAIVTDDVSPVVPADGVKLFYRTTGTGDSYTSTAMIKNESEGYYVANIPVVKKPGVEYYITATDGEQTSSLPSTDPGSNPFDFAVLPNKNPVIKSHAIITTAFKNKDILFKAEFFDDTENLTITRLYYRSVGELLYKELEMTNTVGDFYEATLPGAEVQEDLEYYLFAQDNLKTKSTLGSEDDPFLIDVRELSFEYSTEKGFNDGLGDPANTNPAVHVEEGSDEEVFEKIDQLTFKAVYTGSVAPEKVSVNLNHKKDFSLDTDMFDMVFDYEIREKLIWRDISEIFPGQTGKVIGYDDGILNNEGFRTDEFLEMDVPGEHGKKQIFLSIVVEEGGAGVGAPKAKVKLEAFDINGTLIDDDIYDDIPIILPDKQPKVVPLLVEDDDGRIDKIKFTVIDADETVMWLKGMTVIEELELNRDDETTTAPELRDDDFRNGEQYIVNTTLTKGEYELFMHAVNADSSVLLLPETEKLPLSVKEIFVYVALGDSYQSGEGVGNSFPSETYGEAYENGTNAEEYTIGEKENTYTFTIDDKDGNSCHRSLYNYAKLNRDKLQPNAEIILVDRTCSGATIDLHEDEERTIVGSEQGDTIHPKSQIQESINRLELINLEANDVDLVTVGMGGNDAKFSDLIVACVAPNILRRLVEEYNELETQSTPGEIEFLVNTLGTCQITDLFLFQTGGAINKLYGKEDWAQEKILNTFAHARVLQLNYPSILPSPRKSPQWCSGIRKEDIRYAMMKANQIDRIIRDVIYWQSRDNKRFELVDVSDALGKNALCSSDPKMNLANGISEVRFTNELQRLLKDKEILDQLGSLEFVYRFWKSCTARDIAVPELPIIDLIFGCDSGHAWGLVEEEWEDLKNTIYPTRLTEEILPNLMNTPGSSAEGIDRSRGLFHPNKCGFEILACYVKNHIDGNDSADCECQDEAPLTANAIDENLSETDTVNGNPVTNAPIQSKAGDEVEVHISGFAPSSPVQLVFLSNPIDLGVITSNEEGVVDTTVTLPDTDPGIHSLQFRGDTPSGVGIHKQIRFQYEGRPTGSGSYGTYLCGFTPSSDDSLELEEVEIYYYGELIYSLIPDEDGCVYAVVPIFDVSSNLKTIDIVAKSETTGVEATTKIDPIPSIAGLWSLDKNPRSLLIRGRKSKITGKVHSESDVTIIGAGITLEEVPEYVTKIKVTGKNKVPEGIQVEPGGLPTTYDIADYRPGGTKAIEAGENYHEIPESSCKKGKWKVHTEDIPDGVVYTPCSVHILPSHSPIYARPTFANAQIISEGSIKIAGRNITFGPQHTQNPVLLSNENIKITGRGVNIRGTIQALNGKVNIQSSRGTYACGIIANKISLAGKENSIIVNTDCTDDPEEGASDYSPYCGDGEVNQEWEQCDQEEGCTQQCLLVQQDVCDDIVLARVITENVENEGEGNMTSDIYLGSNTNVIPSGAWFLLSVNGEHITDPDINDYKDVPGLAIARNENTIQGLIVGEHERQTKSKEHIFGKVELWNTKNSLIKNTKKNRSEKPFNRRIDTKPDEDELWKEDGNSYFWLTVKPKNDSFRIDYQPEESCLENSNN